MTAVDPKLDAPPATPSAFGADPEKLIEVFKMLDALAPTEGIKASLAIVQQAILEGVSVQQMGLVLGVSAVSTLLETHKEAVGALEAQAKATRALVLEVELLRECVDGVKAAIFDHTTQAFHATR
jgi:hypothetical protein